MNDLRPIPLVIVVLLGAASAAVTSYLLNPSATPAPTPIRTAVDPSAELLGVIRELRDELAKVNSRVDVLEVTPAERVALGANTNQDFEAEVRAWMAQQNPGRGPAVPVLHADVTQALNNIRAGEKADQEDLDRQRREEFLAGAMESIAPRLNLTQSQSDDMYEVLNAKAEADAELGRRWKAGEDREAIGESKRLDEDNHQNNLQGILSATQYTDYGEMVTQYRKGGK